MATITELGTRDIDTTAFSAGVHPTVVTTPAVNDLIVVVVYGSNTSDAVYAVTDNNSDGLGTTYHQAALGWNAATDRAVSVHIRTALVGSATSTTFTATSTGGSNTGGGIAVFKVTGMSKAGATAKRQSAEHDSGTAGATPTCTLPGVALTTNPLIGGLIGQSAAGSTTHRGTPAWTEAFDVGYSTPATDAECMFINSGETASSITWGGTHATVFSAVVVELDASAAAGTGTRMVIVTGF